MAKNLPTPETMRKLLMYNPKTGKMFWKKRDLGWFRDNIRSAEAACRTWNTRYADKEAFTGFSGLGYKHGHVLGVQITAHRVAWVLHHGRWPNGCIDHINGIKDDNRIENLRDSSKSENARNALKPSDNTSGVCGVYWARGKKKWHARITVEGETHDLGYFNDLEDAARARKVAEIENGFTERHGS